MQILQILQKRTKKMTENTILKKLDQGRQFRRNDIAPEFRALDQTAPDDTRMMVQGHATTFNQPYELGSYRDWNGVLVIVREQVDPHAFDECDMSDVIFQYDHTGRVMARSRNDTLTVAPDETGLLVNVDLSKSEKGPGLYRDIKNGIIDRMSFGFTINEDKKEETRDRENNTVTILRTITKIGKLYDVSAVSIPANDGTDISARSYFDGVIKELEAERLKAQEQQRQKQQLELELALMEAKK